MRIIRLTVQWILVLSFTCLAAWSQAPPLSVEAFAEGGGSVIRNTASPPPPCLLSGRFSCPGPLTLSDAGRLFAGARIRTGHDAFEASYSYSPNQVAGYNRLNLLSFNYIREVKGAALRYDRAWGGSLQRAFQRF